LSYTRRLLPLKMGVQSYELKVSIQTRFYKNRNAFFLHLFDRA